MPTRRIDVENVRKFLEKLAKGMKEVKTNLEEMKIRLTEVKTSQDEMKIWLADEIKSTLDKLIQDMKEGQKKFAWSMKSIQVKIKELKGISAAEDALKKVVKERLSIVKLEWILLRIK